MATTKKTAPKTADKDSAPKKTAQKKSVEKKVTDKTAIPAASKIRIIVKSFDYTMIDEAAKSIFETAERNGSLVSGPVPLPTKIKKYTVNRSFFVNKDARDQYEIRTHKRLIDIKEPTAKTVESLQNLSLPSGVNVEIKML
ncbi:30S ribosomal protein S10 [bacterium]|jgi:small subunit ribosomal protein S10|nr:30S ribosomal protein S10 [bacterium]MBT6832430.1 30S ribosomal protein S10 [bacterium]MBT6996014.1 30S ribosomal protein S10 [bacterium]MBT7772576.1 30S ribosomal protein S10 [bacterium]